MLVLHHLPPHPVQDKHRLRERCEVLQEVENAKGNIMLFIDEIHTLIGAGAVRAVPQKRHHTEPVNVLAGCTAAHAALV